MATNFIPEKFYVTRKAVGNSDELLGFMVPMHKAGFTERKKTADNWASGPNVCEPIEVPNIPMSGFSLTANKRRMVNKNVIWRCLHPHGFEFEITSDNFSDFLLEIDLKQGIIQTEMIFVRCGGGENYLTFVGSDIHKTANSQNLVETRIPIKELTIGDTITLKNGEKTRYMGSCHILRTQRYDNSFRGELLSLTESTKSERNHICQDLVSNRYTFTKTLDVMSIDNKSTTMTDINDVVLTLQNLLTSGMTDYHILNDMYNSQKIIAFDVKPFKVSDLKCTLVELFNDQKTIVEYFNRKHAPHINGNIVLKHNNSDLLFNTDTRSVYQGEIQCFTLIEQQTEKSHYYRYETQISQSRTYYQSRVSKETYVMRNIDISDIKTVYVLVYEKL